VALLNQAKQVERQMLELARTSRVPDRGRWEALVAKLADDSYSRREAAVRALRQQGLAVVPFLRSQDWQLLDAEQRFRLRRILQERNKSPKCRKYLTGGRLQGNGNLSGEKPVVSDQAPLHTFAFWWSYLEPPGDGDSLTKTAHWLMQDPEIWWILLDRAETPTRRIAAQQLTALLGTPIDFDPEAPLELRETQRRRLEGKVRPRQRSP